MPKRVSTMPSPTITQELSSWLTFEARPATPGLRPLAVITLIWASQRAQGLALAASERRLSVFSLIACLCVGIPGVARLCRAEDVLKRLKASAAELLPGEKVLLKVRWYDRHRFKIMVLRGREIIFSQTHSLLLTKSPSLSRFLFASLSPPPDHRCKAILNTAGARAIPCRGHL